MSVQHPSDLLVRDRVDAAIPAGAAAVTELLPAGWRQLHVPGVGRPVVIGPGGVFVIEFRHAGTLALGLAGDGIAPRPWSHDHDRQLSAPRVAAELASQLLTWACGVPVSCTAVVVVLDDRSGTHDVDGRSHDRDEPRPAARPDGVEVVPETRLVRWLQHLPAELDIDTIGLVLEHVDAGGDLLAI